MNTETYEQISPHDEALGDAIGYLLPETVITVDFYEEQPGRPWSCPPPSC